MALYHTHRPQTFDSVIGQEHIVRTIMNEIAQEKLSHAYLFSGPRGVGKTTVARVLAKALNCPNRGKGAEPCNTCSSCEEISGGHSIDVIEIDAASHTGVDNVRDNIIENAQFKPTKSPYKVFIIDEVHMLSTAAFNALLKTLEEPPAHVIFVLATTELQKLPETIISRCQRFGFKKIPYEIMKQYLKDVAKEEKVKIDDDVLDRIINKSDGCARDALSLLDQVFSTGEKHITADVASVVLPTSPIEETAAFVGHCIHKDAEKALGILTTLVDNGVNLMQFSIDVIELLRVVMITKVSGKFPTVALDVGEEVKTSLEQLGKETSILDVIALTDLATKRRLEIRTAPIPQLPLELLVLEWCHQSVQVPVSPAPMSQPAKQPAPAPASVQKQPPVAAVLEEAPEPVEEIVIHEPVEEPKKTIIEQVKEFISSDATVSKEQVSAQWPNFLVGMERISPSLVFILKMANIITINGNTVMLTVPYTFHRDKLLSPTSHRQIEQQLSEVCGSILHVDVTVDETGQQMPEAAPNPELIALAAALGGDIVQSN